MSAHLASYHRETGANPSDLLATGDENTVDVIFDRAAACGEINPEHLTERVRSPPFDLLRHEVLTTFARGRPDAGRRVFMSRPNVNSKRSCPVPEISSAA